MTVTYPPGYISTATVAERIACDPWTVRRWLRRDPTWAGAIAIGVNIRALPDHPTYPPPPPRRRKHPAKVRRATQGRPPNPESLRSIGKLIGYSHQGVKYLMQHGRLGYEDGRWVVYAKERS